MGKKIKGDEDALSTQPLYQDTAPLKTSEKRHKKKKIQHKEEEEEEEPESAQNLKRKIEETETQETSNKEEEEEEKKKKKKKKKRKNKEEKEDGKESQNLELKDEEEEEVNGKRRGDGQDRVVVTGKDSAQAKYSPLKSFAGANLPDNVLQCCKNFKEPSPIQAYSWPFLLDGRDFIGIAKTGSGKTLAYGIPALVHVLNKRREKSTKKINPICLILAPTRELAEQISNVLCEAGKPCGVKSVCLYGGTSKEPQISALKAGVDIVIGTPGRLKDLIEMGICCLGEVSYAVLDEADRMLDMGFRVEVRNILSNIGSACQMIMFSATWPLDVNKLAEEYMDANPVKVVIGSEDTAANHDVMQIVEVLDDRARDDRLVALLEKYHKSQRNRVLVFALYKNEAERLEGMLKRRGWKVVGIHGDKKQQNRTQSLALFKKGTCPLMVATDVAARGLDIPDVEVVINYTYPLTTEDYVHRIGRTGRAGKKGVAHTFFTPWNKGFAGELVNVLREAGQVVPAALLKFGTHVKKKESKLYGSHFREISADAPKAKKITFNLDDEE